MGASVVQRPNFHGENFRRCRVGGCNKSTVSQGLADRPVAIFAVPSTCLRGETIFRSTLCSANPVLPRAQGIGDMRHLRSMLRSAPSRIGRRLALIVAIAAASLPAAGA
jgi:hypothetical protein